MAHFIRLISSVCSVNKLVLSILILSFTRTNAQWAIDDEGCRTPDRKVGSCVEVRDCEPMTTVLLQAPKPLSREVVQLLRDYRCGFVGSSVKVCCPDSPIIVGGGGGSPPSSGDSPPDVSRHRNIGLLPLDSCGPLPSGDRIIGGNKTVLFEFPWMALLSYQTGSGLDFRCGGTIISERYILTAAHCLTNLGQMTLVGVRSGEYNVSSEFDCEQQKYGDEVCAPPVQDIQVERSIPHANYNPRAFTNDIGLIRLANPLDMTAESVKPICLPLEESNRNYDYTNENLIVTGWGATETGRKSPDLLKVDVPIISNAECARMYQRANITINHRQICAGGKNRKDSCGGDSGGPLQTLGTLTSDSRFVQHGVVSFGPRFCGQDGYPGVYTRVQYYMDWILDNMSP